jgi:uridine kinase
MIMANRELLSSFVQNIITDRSVILIGGTGCVGKSTYAHELSHHLQQTPGIRVPVLDLDSYLIERAVRESKNPEISGYNPKGYELQKACHDIETLLKGGNIYVTPYNKATSTRPSKVRMEPGSILILDGVMVLTDEIRKYGTIGIFFDTTPEIEYQNRVKRETELGFSMDRIRKKFSLLQQDRVTYIDPLRSKADIIIEIGSNYEFLKIEIPKQSYQYNEMIVHLKDELRNVPSLQKKINPTIFNRKWLNARRTVR